MKLKLAYMWRKWSFVFFVVFVLTVLFVSGTYVSAEEEGGLVLLEGDLPGIGNAVNPSLQTYLPAIFRLGIGIAVVLAVLMIVIGGIKYMTSDVIGSKEDAKEQMTQALFGLLLAIASVIILQTINPALLEISLP